MSAKSPIAWLDDVDPKDYGAALNYLTLKFSFKTSQQIVDAMKNAPIQIRRANDILRATGLPALPLSDPGVKHSLLKVMHGEELSPVLVHESGKDIADGYHRVSLAYNIDPFMMVPLRMAG